MSQNRILIVHLGAKKEELQALGAALQEAAGLVGISPELMRDRRSLMTLEDLQGKEWSVELTLEDRRPLYGRIICLGMPAYKKIECQDVDGFILKKIPQPKTWDESLRPKVVEHLADLLKLWAPDTPAPSAEKSPEPAPEPAPPQAGAVAPPEPAQPPAEAGPEQDPEPQSPQESTESEDKIDIKALEDYLNMEVAQSEMKTCIFQWTEVGATYTVQSPMKTLSAPLEDVVPVLVDEKVLEDEAKLKEIRDQLDDAGYRNPYLLTVRNFTVLVGIALRITKGKRVIAEITPA